MSHSSVFLVFKWSRSNESTGSSQHVITWDCIELRFSNIKKICFKNWIPDIRILCKFELSYCCEVFWKFDQDYNDKGKPARLLVCPSRSLGSFPGGCFRGSLVWNTGSKDQILRNHNHSKKTKQSRGWVEQCNHNSWAKWTYSWH